jgi:DNA mismatch endonuclease, patch repair protein
MDHVPKEVRSRIMAAIHSRGNTTTERPLAKLLWAAGLRGYRKYWPVAGKPDFAWPGRKVAVFVDGCFWHGCRCKYLPRTNTEFWRDKIETNKRRDRRVSRKLRRDGWTVVRIKECAVRKPSSLTRIVKALGKEDGRTNVLRAAHA